MHIEPERARSQIRSSAGTQVWACPTALSKTLVRYCSIMLRICMVQNMPAGNFLKLLLDSRMCLLHFNTAQIVLCMAKVLSVFNWRFSFVFSVCRFEAFCPKIFENHVSFCITRVFFSCYLFPCFAKNLFKCQQVCVWICMYVYCFLRYTIFFFCCLCLNKVNVLFVWFFFLLFFSAFFIFPSFSIFFLSFPWAAVIFLWKNEHIFNETVLQT